MNPLRTAAQMLIGVFGCLCVAPSMGQTDAGKTNQIRIEDLRGTAEISTDQGANWIATTKTGQVLLPSFRLRTSSNSRVTLRWSDQSIVPVGALTEIEILPPREPGTLSGLHLFRGILSFFHREQPGRIRVIASGAVAGVKGTEFVMAVHTANNIERATLWVIDGRVELTNELGMRVVTNGRQAVVELGKAPEPITAGFIANNVLQWAFYYPAVLDLRDLPLTDAEKQTLGESLAAYRQGDLLAALEKYPANRQPGSEAERVYYAALLLSVGQVDKTQATLAALPAIEPSDRLPRLATALRQLIAAVKRETNFSALDPQLSTELLAASYYEQSRAMGDDSLKAALKLARQAATNSPDFGFAWARVAEFEFSFGHTDEALEALNKSLGLSPRNAQALALKGFLLVAKNKSHEAIGWFDRAIAVDSALGNAWLGRGLCRIRRGDLTGGRGDLLLAAALEPQRALLRSYLGKAYGEAGDAKRALHELDLAKGLDPNDPTSWLYSALERRMENQINPAIEELEKSVDLNENRRLYRSRLLLDQDRAVRGANLAQIYQDAGMNEVSVREAARAVSYDYGNYSAHLFLSQSFDALRDPTRFNLRYETAWFNELLLANLLSPVGGTPLSQNLSQQEYSRLFERNRIGLSSATEYRSDGQVREVASQFGTIGNTGWSLDLDYQHNDGVRPNNELDRIEWYTTIKHQLTPQDSLMLLVKYQDYQSGDNFQYFDWRQNGVRTNFSFDEFQHPIAVGGYHHEWTPGIHTLLFGGRLENEQRFSDRQAGQDVIFERTNGVVDLYERHPFDVDYRSTFEIFTGEINQIFQIHGLSLVAGGRAQTGHFDTRSVHDNPPPGLIDFFSTNGVPDLPVVTQSTDDFAWLSGYGYGTFQPVETLSLTAGLAYERVTYPRSHRNPPISKGSITEDQLSPKAALLWNPLPGSTLRGVYTRSLGGVSFDESFRLEPAQLSGFPQSFRTIISESLVGSVSAPEHETMGLALDLKLAGGTYLGLQAERLQSAVDHVIGVFRLENSWLPLKASSTREKLDYEEQSLSLTLNQLLSSEWALGASYRFTRSELDTRLPEVPATAINASLARTFERSDLHQAGLHLLFNHPAGFFARAEANWYWQDNWRAEGHPSSAQPSPDDQFVHVNFFTGYRFLRRRLEVSLGLLNLTDRDYHLNPLTPYAELPHERVFLARLRFNF